MHTCTKDGGRALIVYCEYAKREAAKGRIVYKEIHLLDEYEHALFFYIYATG